MEGSVYFFLAFQFIFEAAGIIEEGLRFSCYTGAIRAPILY